MSIRAIILSLFLIVSSSSAALAEKLRIVALGDSLTAGYGLQAGEDYANQLQQALISKGLDVKIDNAGVSGDTTAGGLSRLEWVTAGEPKPALVIVALGANDMLRAIDPSTTESNLRSILKNLKDKDIPAVLYGMKAPINMPPAYRKSFNDIYPTLSEEFDVPLYPFFLEGIAMNSKLNLDDGVHPTKEGVALMVEKTSPLIEKQLK
ncbi:MAG: arylesterase [Micavibrio aeruginosavorus]|uniref:Arylesterase n=1 Tax=Micavibrio aeruginosavorus TaxID=349221 RepID=A0A2W5FPC9_9BACT|nr:MAG: arylesterase [Micavibrio aeruginosavorus]